MFNSLMKVAFVCVLSIGICVLNCFAQAPTITLLSPPDSSDLYMEFRDVAADGLSASGVIMKTNGAYGTVWRSSSGTLQLTCSHMSWEPIGHNQRVQLGAANGLVVNQSPIEAVYGEPVVRQVAQPNAACVTLPRLLNGSFVPSFVTSVANTNDVAIGHGRLNNIPHMVKWSSISSSNPTFEVLSDNGWFEIDFNVASPIAVSADGEYIAGHTWANQYNEMRGFRWSETGGFEFFTRLYDTGDPVRPDTKSISYDISDDGNVVVGWTYETNLGNVYPFRWTSGTEVVNLPSALGSGDAIGYARSTNSDGSVIVGSEFNGTFYEPVMWNVNGGIHLAQYLDDRGVTVPSEFVEGGIAWGVSPNGRFIVGGTNSEQAFVIDLGACTADFNQDGFVDFFDYTEFVECFEDSVCPPWRTADFNGDNFVDFADFDEYVNMYEAGGC
jgi:hypothetical protein